MDRDIGKIKIFLFLGFCHQEAILVFRSWGWIIIFCQMITLLLCRASQAVEEDGMWKIEEDGTADSSKNHKNWNSGAARSGRFITK